MSKDGGPAFPTEGQINEMPESRGGGHSISMNGGITVRDYFAAKAMQAIIESKEYQGWRYFELVAKSYQYADAILKERAK